ncbi:MAG: hypothetical protein ABI151_07315, partial [Chitinophagaceae bacterium]
TVVFLEEPGHSIDIIQAAVEVFQLSVCTYLAGCPGGTLEVVVYADTKHILCTTGLRQSTVA